MKKKYLVASIMCFFASFVALLLMLLLSGCGGESSPPESPLNTELIITPSGYQAKIPPIAPLYSQTWIIFDEELGKEFVAYSLDQKIGDCLQLYNNEGGLLEKARGITYEIFNDYAFPCSVSYTGLCAGWSNKTNLIKATLYAKWGGDEYPVFQTHPGLMRSKQQMYEWSGIEGWITQGYNWYASDLWTYNNDWIGLEVVCHELEHCWGKISDDNKIKLQGVTEDYHYIPFAP